MSEVRGKSTLQYFHVRYKMDGNNGKKENKWGLESLTSTFHRQYKCYLSAAKMYLLFLRNIILTCKGQETDKVVIAECVLLNNYKAIKIRMNSNHI